MKIKWIIFTVLFSFLSVNSQSKYYNRVNNIIDEIKTKYAPDKRISLFEIEIRKANGNLTLFGETNLTEAKVELMDKIKAENIKVKDEVLLLPDKRLGDKTFGIVNLSVANLRSESKHPAELTTQALLGTIVKVLKSKNDFYLIQTPDEYISWVDDDGIVLVNRDQLNDWISNPKIIFLKDFGFAYSEPDEKSQRVSDLVIGNILIEIGEDDNFVKVQFPNKRIAYIKNDEIKSFEKWVTEVNPTKENIIETAKTFMGTPYLWGGTSAKGMDCSGFTKTVYFLNGFVLDRDASQQVNKGTLVDTENGFENLQKGDLLFFGTKETKKSKERITHVAIYIGGLEFIHAAGLVKINSFDETKHNFSQYRLDHFIRARRIISSMNKNGIIPMKSSKFYMGDL